MPKKSSFEIFRFISKNPLSHEVSPRDNNEYDSGLPNHEEQKRGPKASINCQVKGVTNNSYPPLDKARQNQQLATSKKSKNKSKNKSKSKSKANRSNKSTLHRSKNHDSDHSETEYGYELFIMLHKRRTPQILGQKGKNLKEIETELKVRITLIPGEDWVIAHEEHSYRPELRSDPRDSKRGTNLIDHVAIIEAVRKDDVENALERMKSSCLKLNIKYLTFTDGNNNPTDGRLCDEWYEKYHHNKSYYAKSIFSNQFNNNHHNNKRDNNGRSRTNHSSGSTQNNYPSRQNSSFSNVSQHTLQMETISTIGNIADLLNNKVDPHANKTNKQNALPSIEARSSSKPMAEPFLPMDPTLVDSIKIPSQYTGTSIEELIKGPDPFSEYGHPKYGNIINNGYNPNHHASRPIDVGPTRMHSESHMQGTGIWKNTDISAENVPHLGGKKMKKPYLGKKPRNLPPKKNHTLALNKNSKDILVNITMYHQNENPPVIHVQQPTHPSHEFLAKLEFNLWDHYDKQGSQYCPDFFEPIHKSMKIGSYCIVKYPTTEVCQRYLRGKVNSITSKDDEVEVQFLDWGGFGVYNRRDVFTWLSEECPSFGKDHLPFQACAVELVPLLATPENTTEAFDDLLARSGSNVQNSGSNNNYNQFSGRNSMRHLSNSDEEKQPNNTDNELKIPISQRHLAPKMTDAEIQELATGSRPATSQSEETSRQPTPETSPVFHMSEKNRNENNASVQPAPSIITTQTDNESNYSMNPSQPAVQEIIVHTNNSCANFKVRSIPGREVCHIDDWRSFSKQGFLRPDIFAEVIREVASPEMSISGKAKQYVRLYTREIGSGRKIYIDMVGELRSLEDCDTNPGQVTPQGSIAGTLNSHHQSPIMTPMIPNHLNGGLTHVQNHHLISNINQPMSPSMTASVSSINSSHNLAAAAAYSENMSFYSQTNAATMYQAAAQPQMFATPVSGVGMNALGTPGTPQPGVSVNSHFHLQTTSFDASSSLIGGANQEQATNTGPESSSMIQDPAVKAQGTLSPLPQADYIINDVVSPTPYGKSKPVKAVSDLSAAAASLSGLATPMSATPIQTRNLNSLLNQNNAHSVASPINSVGLKSQTTASPLPHDSAFNTISGANMPGLNHQSSVNSNSKKTPAAESSLQTTTSGFVSNTSGNLGPVMTPIQNTPESKKIYKSNICHMPNQESLISQKSESSVLASPSTSVKNYQQPTSALLMENESQMSQSSLDGQGMSFPQANAYEISSSQSMIDYFKNTEMIRLYPFLKYENEQLSYGDATAGYWILPNDLREIILHRLGMNYLQQQQNAFMYGQQQFQQFDQQQQIYPQYTTPVLSNTPSELSVGSHLNQVPLPLTSSNLQSPMQNYSGSLLNQNKNFDKVEAASPIVNNNTKMTSEPVVAQVSSDLKTE